MHVIFICFTYRVVPVASFVAKMMWNKIDDELKQRFKAIKTEDDVVKLMEEFVQ